MELFAKGSDTSYHGKLLEEILRCAALDSGCSKPVCSEKGFQSHIDTLDESQIKMIRYKDNCCQFRFGEGSVFKSSKVATIPANISSKQILIETVIIDNGLPPLRSKNAMQKANTVIDFQNNQVSMFGKCMYQSEVYNIWTLLLR